MKHKGKVILIVSAVLLSTSLVGTTFAVWAASNKPFENSNVSPSVITENDDKNVVLSWGDKGLIDIEEINAGEEKGPYKVGLIASTSDDSGINGKFTVTITSPSSSEYSILNYLTVGVYDDNLKSNELLKISPTSSSKESSIVVQLQSRVATNVYFFISLSNDAESHMEEIVDTATITIDLTKTDDLPVVETIKHYFDNSITNWSKVYAYAWNSNGVTTKSWPGIELQLYEGTIYAISISKDFDFIMFSDGGINKTDTLELNKTTSYIYSNGNWSPYL